MNELLILGALVLVPVSMFGILRVPAIVVFFSVLIGNLLATEASVEAYEFVSGLFNLEQYKYIQLGLFVLPIVLGVLFMRGRVPKSKIVIEVLPHLFATLLAIVLLFPILPELKSFADKTSDGQIDEFATLIIVISAVFAIFSLWKSYPKAHKKHKF